MAKRTRRAVVDDGKPIKKLDTEEKYASTPGVDHFFPTSEQKTAINVARSNTLSFIIGPPGTGKSSAIMWDYCKEYLKNPSKQIVVVKSPTEAGQLDKIGYLKGDLSDKLEAHFVSNRKILDDFLGKGKVDCDLGKRIHFLIPNFLLGQTLDNCLIVVEEAQQLQPMLMKLILERTGQNSRVCVLGDPLQLYTDSKETKLRNGLTDAVNRFFNTEEYPLYDDVGLYRFSSNSVVRSEIVKTVIRAYYGG